MSMSFKKVLVAVENSPIAAHAVDVGIELARSLKAEIALIHVTEPPIAYAVDAGISTNELMAQAKREDQKLLTGVRERLSLPASVQDFLPAGDPATEILKAATEWPADIIVLGSHGRTGVSRVLLGSVAEAVTRHAPCPVLVVRARK
jgi:nucleotide-binding universal stress UspA family protein